MRIITEPQVYLVGRQSIDDAGLARFLADHDAESWTTDTDHAGQKLVEVAGRLCYMSFAAPRPGGNAAYVGHLLEVGHGSVLEHAVFNFIIAGVSRSFTHELVRHRAGFGYSQLSQRFVDESDAAFVVPPLIDDSRRRAARGHHWGVSPEDDKAQLLDKEIFAAWEKAIEASQEAYGRLFELIHNRLDRAAYGWDKTAIRKAAREAARSVLPNATETKIFVTGNARALRHFIELRADPAADAEIRRVALAMLAILRREAPNLFGDFEANERGATTPHRKV